MAFTLPSGLRSFGTNLGKKLPTFGRRAGKVAAASIRTPLFAGGTILEAAAQGGGLLGGAVLGTGKGLIKTLTMGRGPMFTTTHRGVEGTIHAFTKGVANKMAHPSKPFHMDYYKGVGPTGRLQRGLFAGATVGMAAYGYSQMDDTTAYRWEDANGNPIRRDALGASGELVTQGSRSRRSY
jgi:hypothetical protein